MIADPDFSLDRLSLMTYEKERRAALDAVRLAARLCEQVGEKLGTSDTLTKDDRSPVTVADFGAQAVVSLTLARAFPNDPMIGEEDAGELRRSPVLADQVAAHVGAVHPGPTSPEILDAIDRCRDAGGATGRRWVLDPIDGTKGFLRGGQYAIALALLDEGEVVLGVLGCPRLRQGSASGSAGSGCRFVATRGEGACELTIDADETTSIGVSGVAEAADAAFCESVEAAHSAHGEHAEIALRLGVTTPPIRMDSQCKYAAVARGDASIYLRLPTSSHYQEKVWDHAAGWILVREAGGEVTDAHGAPLDFSRGRTLSANRGIIATNGRLHRQVESAVRLVTRQQ